MPIVFLLCVAGCVTTYRTEIQQGNVLTQEMLEKLKPGMTKSQVRFVLGTPLINDPFHPDRWDYVYMYRKNLHAPAETRNLSVVFQGDAMLRVDGDIAGAAPPPINTPPGPAAPSATNRDKPSDLPPPATRAL
jgi:outer membrane protein assembly factor BamE